MVEGYECKSCGLHFELGWFHFHRVSEGGAGGKTLLVCKACGTQHAVTHIVGDSSKDEVHGQPGPLLQELGYFGDKRERIEAKTTGPVRPVRAEMPFPTLEAYVDKLCPEVIVCVHCGTEGRVIDSWPFNVRWYCWKKCIAILQTPLGGKTPFGPRPWGMPNRYSRLRGRCPNCGRAKLSRCDGWMT